MHVSQVLFMVYRIPVSFLEGEFSSCGGVCLVIERSPELVRHISKT